MNRLETDALCGAAAGAVATIAMTAAFVSMARRLRRRHQYELPTKLVVKDLAARAGTEPEKYPAALETATWTAHFGYGTTMGVLYGMLPRELRRLPAASGIGWGLAVWAASYLGWMPALDMQSGAHREPRDRNRMNLLSHVVWGAVTGVLTAAAASTVNGSGDERVDEKWVHQSRPFMRLERAAEAVR